tara:strand:- start:384 stop:809 length:426 start_codon:yes stop_codon:yes gene_type:complete
MVQRESKKVLIIYSDFYPKISENLLLGAESFLIESKVKYEKKRVDGSLEIPFLLSKYMGKFSGFVIIGCVIKGETDHYHIVKDICLNEVYSLAYKNKIPLGSAILTVDNFEQAIERSDVKKRNLGKKAAIVCCNLMKTLSE